MPINSARSYDPCRERTDDSGRQADLSFLISPTNPDLSEGLSSTFSTHLSSFKPVETAKYVYSTVIASRIVRRGKSLRVGLWEIAQIESSPIGPWAQQFRDRVAAECRHFRGRVVSPPAGTVT